MKVLEVENLIRNYRRSSLKKSEEDVKVLKGLNFAVEEGEFVGIMGKSGCGKTTLLKVLGMIDKQTGGTVRVLQRMTADVTLGAGRKQVLGTVNSSSGSV